VVAFDYDGNQRRGLVARCRREDGSEHVIGAAEIVLAARVSGIQFLAAYRKWLGLDPMPEQVAGSARRTRQHKVAPTDLDLSRPIELVVLSVKDRAVRCRLPSSDRIISLRTSRLIAKNSDDSMTEKVKKPNQKLQAWIDARKRHHLSHAQVQMARELGMNPAQLGKLNNHKQEPWKVPLPQFIEELHFRRFGETAPDAVMSIEDRARLEQQNKEARRG
jgi:hypothetical protein